MSTEKIRIRMKAYDHKVLDNAVTKIVETIKRSGGDISGPFHFQLKSKSLLF